MESTNLVTLQVVARQGSMAGAARELGLTANAIALRLRILEKEIGSALVTRAGRTVRPTEAGHAVLERLPRILEELRNLRALANGTEVSGELRIGAISTAMTGYLPHLLERLAVEYPKLTVHLIPATSAILFDQICDEHLDAAVIVKPDFDLAKSMGFVPLRHEPLVLMVPMRETRTDPLAILRTEPAIVYDRNQWGGRLAYSWLVNAGIRIQARFELDALDAIALMVDRGLGVAVVPDWASPRPAGINLNILPLPPGAPGRTVGILYKRQGPRARLVSELIDAAIKSIQTGAS